MNVSDAERVAAALEGQGYEKTSKISAADLVCVVMCSVRQSAVDRVFGVAEKIKRLKKKPKTILTGCILKKDKKTFSQLFDQVLSIKEMQNSDILPKYSGKTRAFLPISNGCNNSCTYCVVPQARGRLVCRDHKIILEEAKGLIGAGFKEIWLLGQNVNDYFSPSDKSVDFAALLSMVNDLPRNFKIFFMSPNPKNFSDRLIKAMAQAKKFSRYLNLPVQSGDDKILKAMNRPYTAKKYVELVKKIRKAMPDINLSTDVIVGFPGETKNQFENTAKLFKKIKLNIAYINKYSPRWGTAASKLKDDVSLAGKKHREKALQNIINGER